MIITTAAAAAAVVSVIVIIFMLVTLVFLVNCYIMIHYDLLSSCYIDPDVLGMNIQLIHIFLGVILRGAGFDRVTHISIPRYALVASLPLHTKWYTVIVS